MSSPKFSFSHQNREKTGAKICFSTLVGPFLSRDRVLRLLMAWSRLIKGGKERVCYSTYLFTSVEFNFPHPPPLPKKKLRQVYGKGGHANRQFSNLLRVLDTGVAILFFRYSPFFTKNRGFSRCQKGDGGSGMIRRNFFIPPHSRSPQNVSRRYREFKWDGRPGTDKEIKLEGWTQKRCYKSKGVWLIVDTNWGLPPPPPPPKSTLFA